MSTQPFGKPSLYGDDGRRKYLNAAERTRFIRAARNQRRADIGALCLVLTYTGCRISEALALTKASVQLEEGVIAIRSLKKREKASFRQVPVPSALLRELVGWSRRDDERLWHLSRTRAWQIIKSVMSEAKVIPGPHATPKGLRHAFGLHAIEAGVPLHLVQRWLGHAALSTTAIYLDVVGHEERQMARRMWS